MAGLTPEIIMVKVEGRVGGWACEWGAGCGEMSGNRRRKWPAPKNVRGVYKK
jgi:hypothetical protein